MASRGALLLAGLAATVRATGDAASFEIVPELPANSSHPSQREYVAIMAADQTALPPGTTFLKLVIVDPGCGGATPDPIPWAPMPSTQRLLFAPVNYNSTWNEFGTAKVGLATCPDLQGVVKVKAEAWSGRRLEHNDQAGKKLGESNTVDVHWDFRITAAKFSKFEVTATGPGEADVTFRPPAADAAMIDAATQLGGYYYVRVWPCGDKCPPTLRGTDSGGEPQFSAAAFDGQQQQQKGPTFRRAWTQPGTYYYGLNGAWSGQTTHNVVQSPMDGVHTAAFPQVDGVFQPVAIMCGASVHLPLVFAPAEDVLLRTVSPSRMGRPSRRRQALPGPRSSCHRSLATGGLL